MHELQAPVRAGLLTNEELQDTRSNSLASVLSFVLCLLFTLRIAQQNQSMSTRVHHYHCAGLNAGRKDCRSYLKQFINKHCLVSGQSGSSPANCNCADAEHCNFRRSLFAHIRVNHGLGLALNAGLLSDLRLRHDGPRLGLNTASLHLRILYEQEKFHLSVLKRAITAKVVSRCQYGFSS